MASMMISSHLVEISSSCVRLGRMATGACSYRRHIDLDTQLTGVYIYIYIIITRLGPQAMGG